MELGEKKIVWKCQLLASSNFWVLGLDADFLGVGVGGTGFRLLVTRQPRESL